MLCVGSRRSGMLGLLGADSSFSGSSTGSATVSRVALRSAQFTIRRRPSDSVTDGSVPNTRHFRIVDDRVRDFMTRRQVHDLRLDATRRRHFISKLEDRVRRLGADVKGFVVGSLDLRRSGR